MTIACWAAGFWVGEEGIPQGLKPLLFFGRETQG
jgi:hypothetical protein